MFHKELLEMCKTINVTPNIGYKNNVSLNYDQLENVIFISAVQDEENPSVTTNKILIQLNDNRFVYYSVKVNKISNKIHGFGLIDNNFQRMIQLGLDSKAREEFYSKHLHNNNVQYEGVELDFTRKTIEGLESIKI